MKRAVARDAIRQQNPAAHDETGPDSALLRALLQDGSVAFACYGADCRYLQVSRALAEINGLSVEEHLGRLPREVLPGEFGALVEESVARVLATGKSWREPEQRWETAQWAPAPRGPGVRVLRTHWSPVLSPSGGITGVLAIVHDVTDRHRIAELLGSTQWRIGKLQTVARELAGALTLGEVRAAVAKLGQVTGASHVELRLLDQLGRSPWPQTRTVRPVPAQRSVLAAEDERWERRTTSWPPLLAAAVRTGQPCYLADRAAVRALFPDAAEWEDSLADEQSWAVLPLTTAAGPVGGLYLVYESARAFEEDDQAYLQALAGQCTMAVARARMHEREHRQVVSLQDALLPKRLPDLPGIDAAFRYIPGSLDTEVGGDWYDLFGFPDGRLGMVVGDVIGKGVTAAAGMGRVRAALRALAFSDPSPRAVLTGLDRLFDATENAESLTTVVYAVYDPAAGSLVMSDAGHLPLLVITAEGDVRFVDATPEATPLGWSEERIEHRFALRPGDTVVGFSDGLVETRVDSLDEGLARLRAAALSAPDTALEPLLDHLLETMLREHEQDDDVTLLAVRVRV
ncbi:SpoIIE family protein phosphatase [Actinocrinis puniceicyclus]|uniref:SpoIIE family protein phosphatase n=1 Tax=Actinocrinis puniceicyclus TaxID=977794 RepID=A0A8J7WSB6_9ACTN|nr:SpoIIE family protein phosphatase [Actinocrinis puniceicyclus]MBS2965840.1 SpoIIE family protein phosphatase [Actinocrinis puniceicyclus]